MWIRKKDVIWGDHHPLLWTLRPRPPLPPPPHPCWAKGRNDHWFVLCEHSPCPAATLRSRDVPGEAQISRRPIVISKPQIFPFRVRSVNNICNHPHSTCISHLAIFSHKSHNIRTHYELNCFCINATIAHLLYYFREHLCSRIEVLHICNLVVGNTNAILHHIRNYSLFHEV